MSRILSSLVQSDFGGGDHSNFEAVILEEDSLVHWWRDNSVANFPWKRGQIIAPSCAAAGSIIQSDFTGGGHGNFEVVVPLWAPDGSMDLWHFWHDNSDVNLPWQRGQRVAANVNGPGVIIQSDFSSGDHGNFEVVAPLYSSDGTRDLWHFWHDNSDVNLPWQRGQQVAVNVDGPGVIIQSDFSSGGHGNFEVVVPVGSSLVHFFHNNSDVNLPWQRGQNITDACGGWGSLMRSNYGSPEHGNFEVLVEECSQSLVGYWHPNQNVLLPWMRDQVLLFEPYPARAASGVRKVAQLTGEYDREGWNGVGTPPLAFNRTESRYGIHGSDLGSSFEHKNRVYFLFGDSVRFDGSEWAINFDSIAFCTDTDLPLLGSI